jgi:20S proteasome alpha/beta subunit
MTIIVGIVCGKALVMASDSQAMTSRGVDVKRLDYTKIYKFDLNSDLKVLITGAGETPFITRAVEVLQDRWREKRVTTNRELADLAEETMNMIQKRYVIDRLKELGVAKSKDLRKPELEESFSLQELGRTPAFVLMLGVLDKTEASIYIIHPDGVAEKVERYSSLGSGSAYAEYLLARLCCQGLKIEEAIKLAIYVIEEVKKIDPNCGGPTQLSVITEAGIAEKTAMEIKKLVDEIMSKDAELTKISRGTILGRKEDLRETMQDKMMESAREKSSK